MTFIDLEPAAISVAALVRGVPEGALQDPTPCSGYQVGDLLDHIAGVATGFTDAATKSIPPEAGPPPEGDASRLDPGWRDVIPEQLDRLVRAWREPGALDGMTRAGGIELPAEVAATVALEELVVHGWDLAQATGQPFAIDDDAVHAVIGFVSQFAGDDQADLRGTAYGPPRPVGPDASLLERAVALTGRDPGWSAASRAGHTLPRDS